MEFIEGKIKISNVKKVEIIEQLEEGDYLKQDDSYDYLLKMPIYNLTKDKIDEFTELLNNKKEELQNLEVQTPKSLWLSDLKELESFMKKNKYFEIEKPKKIKIIKKK